jgi:hypothetical protein
MVTTQDQYSRLLLVQELIPWSSGQHHHHQKIIFWAPASSSSDDLVLC